MIIIQPGGKAIIPDRFQVSGFRYDPATGQFDLWRMFLQKLFINSHSTPPRRRCCVLCRLFCSSADTNNTMKSYEIKISETILTLESLYKYSSAKFYETGEDAPGFLTPGDGLK